MRPQRLTLEGFASFRERVGVDFADADMFALSGPTGAGKSSLIDAMTFALYGAVPRYDHQALVWPVISQGLNEAKVQLDFSVGDAEYRTIRVVRRTSSGATTKEARLEDANGRVLAGTADELSAEVERLIGLPFKHFTRCVVLPQGDFAAFLHARAAERQELLVQLLGLDVYRRIARAANQRSQAAAMKAAVIEQRLDQELAAATEDALRAANERAGALAALLESIEAARPALDAAAAEQDRALEAAREAESRARALEAVAMPAGIDRLARQIAESAAALEVAQAALHSASEAREAADQQLERAGSRGSLDAVLEKHERRAKLADRARVVAEALADAEATSASTTGALTDADRALSAAREQFDRTSAEHAAAHLTERLAIDEPCPVCGQTVGEIPPRSAPADLEVARQKRTAAETGCDRTRAEAQAAAQAVAARRSETSGLREQLDQLDAQLAGQPDPGAIAAALERIDQAEQARLAARAAETESRERLKRARRAATDAEALRSHARKVLDATRDAVAARGLTPPAVGGVDLAEDWHALVAWAAAHSKQERRRARTERAAAEDVRARIEARRREQVEACAAHGITVAKREPRDACADAHARASADAERIARELETARALRCELADLGKAKHSARELGRHLDARNFERWLMNRALRQLVTDATRILRQLSTDAYSLALDDRNDFLVVDHRNADEKRMARTLSGGETFLASLALALALAEHVATLAAAGTTRLEALFLDEGFGTLDAEALDTVAAAIEELGSSGRMVGIVTHVRDLAERLPVRFEVRKVGSVSTVQRIVA